MGPPRRPEDNAEDFLARLRGAISKFKTVTRNGDYADVHNCYFTPDSLKEIVYFLEELKLIDLSVHHVYHTIQGSVEFTIVLENNKR